MPTQFRHERTAEPRGGDRPSWQPMRPSELDVVTFYVESRGVVSSKVCEAESTCKKWSRGPWLGHRESLVTSLTG